MSTAPTAHVANLGDIMKARYIAARGSRKLSKEQRESALEKKHEAEAEQHQHRIDQINAEAKAQQIKKAWSFGGMLQGAYAGVSSVLYTTMSSPLAHIMPGSEAFAIMTSLPTAALGATISGMVNRPLGTVCGEAHALGATKDARRAVLAAEENAIAIDANEDEARLLNREMDSAQKDAHRASKTFRRQNETKQEARRTVAQNAGGHESVMTLSRGSSKAESAVRAQAELVMKDEHDMERGARFEMAEAYELRHRAIDLRRTALRKEMRNAAWRAGLKIVVKVAEVVANACSFGLVGAGVGFGAKAVESGAKVAISQITDDSAEKLNRGADQLDLAAKNAKDRAENARASAERDHERSDRAKTMLEEMRTTIRIGGQA